MEMLLPCQENEWGKENSKEYKRKNLRRICTVRKTWLDELRKEKNVGTANVMNTRGNKIKRLRQENQMHSTNHFTPVKCI